MIGNLGCSHFDHEVDLQKGIRQVIVWVRAQNRLVNGRERRSYLRLQTVRIRHLSDGVHEFLGCMCAGETYPTP